MRVTALVLVPDSVGTDPLDTHFLRPLGIRRSTYTSAVSHTSLRLTV